MPTHIRRSAPSPSTSSPSPRWSPLRGLRRLPFGVASVALVAGCSYGEGAPAAATVAVAPTTVAPAHAWPCGSDDDCRADPSGALCVPRNTARDLSHAEDFLERVMTLHRLVVSLGDTSSSSRMAEIEQQMHDDMVTYSQMSQGRTPTGADAGAAVGGLPPKGQAFTREQMQQMQDAAWLHSGATQAEVLVRLFAFTFADAKSPVPADAQKVQVDILGDSRGLHLDTVVVDVQSLLHDIDSGLASIRQLVGYRYPDGGVPGLKSGAGATARYLGPVLDALKDATDPVNALLDPPAISELDDELTALSREHDGVGRDGGTGTCLGTR